MNTNPHNRTSCGACYPEAPLIGRFVSPWDTSGWYSVYANMGVGAKLHSNEEVTDYFEGHYEPISRVKLTQTKEISGQNLEDLVRMTPLLFDVDKTKLDLSGVTEITIEGEVLVGRKK